jgi:AcrR family transcriptional regulator
MYLPKNGDQIPSAAGTVSSTGSSAASPRVFVARSAVSAGKRERLVAGARERLHAQGVERTTLADVAQAAGVPVGNVYYYFKTKDELVQAVVDSRIEDLHAALQGLERHRTPKAR